MLAWLYLFSGLLASLAFAKEPDDPEWSRQWSLMSGLPGRHLLAPDAWERSHGVGMHMDRAWDLHTGDSATIIAVLDSGAGWGEADLADQWYLHEGELPLPQRRDGSICAVYDCNHDGRFSVSDYAEDSRVSDRNSNGRIDPQDLMRVFSDNIDQDQNGFVDDISGWDFFEDDADPEDRTHFGHGNGEAKDSAAAWGNGIGGAGTCGHCAVVMLRLSDSFIVDSQRFARAVRYATMLQVAVIQQALGALNHDAAAQEATDAATRQRIVIVGTAADEHSYHHNQPSVLDPVIYPNAMRFDGADVATSTSFTEFNNCSNYGARIDVSVPALSCSSEATGQLAGIIALASSYAKKQNIEIDPHQMTALLKQTSSDIAHTPRTHRGWDEFTGYGRVHAYQLLAAIDQKKIPPSLWLRSPQWFSWAKDQMTIEAEIRHSHPIEWTIEVIAGIEGESRTEVLNGRLSAGETRLSESFKVPNLAPSADPRFKDAVTLIVTVKDERGFYAEQRRTIFLDQDPSRLFFHQHPHSLEAGAIAFDALGDGRTDLLTADGAGYLDAWNHRGERIWSIAAVEGEGIFAPVAIADFDGDSCDEVAAVSMQGSLALVDCHGRLKPGFPIVISRIDWSQVTPRKVMAKGILASPVIADLDGDGELDIVVVDLAGDLIAITADGRVKGRTHVVDAKIVSSPAVGDIDGDGLPEVVFGTNLDGRVHVYEWRAHQWSLQPGFPAVIPMLKQQILPTIGSGIAAPPVIVREKNRRLILVHPFVGKMYALTAGGRISHSFSTETSAQQQGSDTHMFPAFGQPSLGRSRNGWDIFTPGVGKKALTNLLVGGKRFPYEHLIGRWDLAGDMRFGAPWLNDDMQIATSAIHVDINADGDDESFIGSGGYFLRGFKADGSMIHSFPKLTGGWMIAPPTIGDFGSDGEIEIAATTREGLLHVWSTDFLVGRSSWPTSKANLQRTGVINVE